MRLLVVDDEAMVLRTVERILKRENYTVHTASDGAEALAAVRRYELDACVVDLNLPDTNGIQLSHDIREIQPSAETIIMTAFSSVETAVQALREGVYDYLTKPVNRDELLANLARIRQFSEMREENLHLKKKLAEVKGFRNLVGKSSGMLDVQRRVELAASTESSVLITGETGTGKEMVVDAIHAHSARRGFPLVKVGCCILPETLIESEIFGHEKGAFTGAQRNREGRFEMAHRGTLFLDDIDDVPLDVQAKLLRFLENNTFERVGGNKTISVDVRVVAATKKNLLELAEQGLFRDDLFYRLSVIPIPLPPLRERQADIPLLVSHFLNEYNQNGPVTVDPRAMRMLSAAEWPGNVRELRNAVELLSISRQGNVVTVEQIDNWLSDHNIPTGARHPGPARSAPAVSLPVEGSLSERLEAFESQLLIEAMERCSHNKARAARELAIPVSTLKSKLKKYELN